MTAPLLLALAPVASADHFGEGSCLGHGDDHDGDGNCDDTDPDDDNDAVPDGCDVEPHSTGSVSQWMDYITYRVRGCAPPADFAP